MSLSFDVPGVVSEHSHTESGTNRLSAARELFDRGPWFLLIYGDP
jgi:hypothetical protein